MQDKEGIIYSDPFTDTKVLNLQPSRAVEQSRQREQGWKRKASYFRQTIFPELDTIPQS